MPVDHIIIGDGVTAAEFATTCNADTGDRITIIGPDVANLGRGVAYAQAVESPWRYAYLLNSPARSVDHAFSEWLQANWQDVVRCMTNRSPDWLSAAKPYVDIDEIASLNAPRELFGDYIHTSVMTKLDAMRHAGINIQMLPTRATAIHTAGDTLQVTTEAGHHLSANSIDVATGGPQNQRFNGDDDEYSFLQLFGNETPIAKRLQNAGSVICIGAGAAMLDLLRFCQSVQAESDIDFTAISTTGKVLDALRPGPTFNPAHFDLTGTFSYAEDFLDEVKQLQKNALAAGHNFYETRVGLRSLFIKTSVHEFLPNIAEARKVAVPLFNHFQGGTRDSIDDFNRLMKTGKTRILAGRVRSIESSHSSTNDGVAAVTYDDLSGQTLQRCASVVVNCAGPGRSNRFDQLTNAMLEKNWINICPQSNGILVGEGARTSIAGVRYLGPAVTSIGNFVQPVPLYDALRLRLAVQQINHAI